MSANTSDARRALDAFDTTPRSRADRRTFLKGLAGSLVVAATIDLGGTPAKAAGGPTHPAPVPPNPNAFIRIAPDNTVTVMIKHLDKGQGVTTGLTTIVAEELDAAWSQMRFAFAPADNRIYNNLLWGPAQGTGGSTAIANSWDQLRKAGAAARAMLVRAAMVEWNVGEADIRINDGIVSNTRNNRTATFGELAPRAASFTVPERPRLKDPSQFKLIGKHVPRIDSADKSTGKAIYSQDIKRPGQLTAVVAHAPKFGAKVRSFDAAAAKAVPGVVDVVAIPSGVAVIARDTWSAMKGREALTVAWDFAGAETRSTDAIMADYKRLAATEGLNAGGEGDVRGAFARAARVIETEFEFPYLAHAAMEPMNGTIALNPDGTVDVWAGLQIQTIEQIVTASILGVTPDKVRLNTIFAGGSFGRRATPNADYIAECAHIVKATGGRAPIHLVWTREDDQRSGYFRPMVYHRVRAALDQAGSIIGWDHVIVGKSILIGSPFEAMLVKDGVDATTVEGANDSPYRLGATRFRVHNAKEGVPVLWWRAVGHTHTAQAMEVTIDECARAAGKDPLAYRLGMLPAESREAAVLKLVGEKAGWQGPAAGGGKARGVAVHESFNSYVAMVADVTVSGTGVKVDRIIAAVDCGIAVNPDNVRSQVEGGVGFALSAVLDNAVTLKDGEVVETNFDSFTPTRMSQMPKVEVHIVPSTAAPTGIGEPGVPPLAPAISNAVAAALGRPVRSLPIMPEGRLRGV